MDDLELDHGGFERAFLRLCWCDVCRDVRALCRIADRAREAPPVVPAWDPRDELSGGTYT